MHNKTPFRLMLLCDNTLFKDTKEVKRHHNDLNFRTVITSGREAVEGLVLGVRDGSKNRVVY